MPFYFKLVNSMQISTFFKYVVLLLLLVQWIYMTLNKELQTPCLHVCILTFSNDLYVLSWHQTVRFSSEAVAKSTFSFCSWHHCLNWLTGHFAHALAISVCNVFKMYVWFKLCPSFKMLFPYGFGCLCISSCSSESSFEPFVFMCRISMLLMFVHYMVSVAARIGLSLIHI